MKQKLKDFIIFEVIALVGAAWSLGVAFITMPPMPDMMGPGNPDYTGNAILSIIGLVLLSLVFLRVAIYVSSKEESTDFQYIGDDSENKEVY